MKISIRLFAVSKQLAGQDSLSVEMAAGSTIGQLREQLAVRVPALAAILPHVLFAVGSEYVQNDWVISPDSDVACIPPVSGG